MFIFLAYLIIFVTGALTLKVILRGSKGINPSFFAALAFMLGAGICAYLTFFSFIIAGKFSRAIIIGLTAAYLMIFSLLSAKEFKKIDIRKIISNFSFNIITLLIIILWLVVGGVILYIANQNRYGGWDAWAMWNLKMRFLILSQQPLHDICRNLHVFTHPDYPLLLPLFNTWVYAFSAADINIIPYIATLFLTIFCPILIAGGLKEFVQTKIYLLAGCLLAVHPFFVFRGIIQYADILLGAYLACGLITVFLFLRQEDYKKALLAGIFLGFSTFTKNEGLAITLLLALFTTIYLLLSKITVKKSLLKNLWLGLLIGFSATAVFKIFFAPPNQDILPYFSSGFLNQISPAKLSFVLTAFVKELFRKQWCYVWILFSGMLVLGFRNFIYKEGKIGLLFFPVYLTIIASVYLITQNVDLKWWIDTSLDRLYFALLPSVIFYCFYCFYRTEG